MHRGSDQAERPSTGARCVGDSIESSVQEGERQLKSSHIAARLLLLFACLVSNRTTRADEFRHAKRNSEERSRMAV